MKISRDDIIEIAVASVLLAVFVIVVVKMAFSEFGH